MRRRPTTDPRLWIDWDRVEWAFEPTGRSPSQVLELLRGLAFAVIVLVYLSGVAVAAYLIATALW